MSISILLCPLPFTYTELKKKLKFQNWHYNYPTQYIRYIIWHSVSAPTTSIDKQIICKKYWNFFAYLAMTKTNNWMQGIFQEPQLILCKIDQHRFTGYYFNGFSLVDVGYYYFLCRVFSIISVHWEVKFEPSSRSVSCARSVSLCVLTFYA